MSACSAPFSSIIFLIVPKYSVVVPFHNEQENVTELYDRLKAAMESVGGSFELVLVDDGSTDRTFALLRDIAAVDSGRHERHASTTRLATKLISDATLTMRHAARAAAIVGAGLSAPNKGFAAAMPS